MSEIATGGCLCGGVRYEVDVPVPIALHCHCSRCRRWTGAAMTSHMAMLPDRFRLVQGAELLRRYATPELALRVFCGVCGSSLFMTDPAVADQEFMVVQMGSLDGDAGVRPMLHESPMN